MKAAKTIAILIALPLLLTCELFSGPYDRENLKDPLNPNYVGWFGIKTVDSTNDVGKYATLGNRESRSPTHAVGALESRVCLYGRRSAAPTASASRTAGS